MRRLILIAACLAFAVPVFAQDASTIQVPPGFKLVPIGPVTSIVPLPNATAPAQIVPAPNPVPPAAQAVQVPILTPPVVDAPPPSNDLFSPVPGPGIKRGGVLAAPDILGTIDSSRVDGGTRTQVAPVGTWASDILSWIGTVAAGPIAILITALIYKALEFIGIKVGDQSRARIEDITKNAVAYSANRAAVKLDGTMNVEVKGMLANSALEYVKAHGKDSIKKLGLDPDDPKAEEAVLARIARTIDDQINAPTASAVTVTAPATSDVAAQVTANDTAKPLTDAPKV